LKVIVDVILGDKANTAIPTRRGVVKNVEEFELGGVVVDKLIKIVLEKNILGIDIGIDEGDGCFVSGVTKDGTDDLDHGSEASTTGDHADVVAHARSVDKVALEALDADGVPYVEGCKDSRNIALFICLKIGRESNRKIRIEHLTFTSRSNLP